MFVKIEENTYANLNSIREIKFFDDLNGNFKARVRFINECKPVDVKTEIAKELNAEILKNAKL